MDQERWKRTNQIFHDALELPAAERQQFITHASSGDADLQLEIEQLLEADRAAGDYLETPLISPESILGNYAPVHRGDRLCNRFDIVREIGQGGMGQVFEAFDSELGVPVALKVIRPEFDSSREAISRFRREVRLARLISHPNVCRTFDLGRDIVAGQDGQSSHEVLFLTMEFLGGESLAARIQRAGSLPPGLAIQIASQIALGIDSAHERGVIHRDLKPGNIMLVPGETENQTRAVITDFGLARVDAPVQEPCGSHQSHLQGVPIGTLAYMAPEQLEGNPTSTATDIYAYGLILFEMVTGKRAFSTENLVDGIRQRLMEPPAAGSGQGLPAQWIRAIEACLRIDPSERPDSARSVIAILNGDSVLPVLRNRAKVARPLKLLWIGPPMILAIVAGVLYRPQPPIRVSSYQQLTRDGKRKYVAGTDGTWIYLTGGPTSVERVSVAGGEIQVVSAMTPVTPTLDWDVSRDGSRVLVDVRGEGKDTLWSVPIHGGAPTRLAVSSDRPSAFTPDGDSVLYLTESGDLHQVRVDGTDDHMLAFLGTTATDARMSPDGKVIRVFKDGIPWEMSSDGTGIHRLLPNWNGPSNLCCGRWSFDGRIYSFLQVENAGTNQLWALDERRGIFHGASRDPVQLTSGPLEWDRPVPDKDGTRVYSVGITYRGELSRIDPHSGQLRPFLGGISAGHVAFSPDGRFITYTGYPIEVLWRANRDGTNPVQLTDGPLSFVSNPRWSPDGKQILIMNAPVYGSPKAYVVPVEGGSPRELLPNDNESQADPNWFPDGRHIVLSGGDPANTSKQYIRILDLATRQLTAVAGSTGLSSPRLSSDGRHIAAQSWGRPAFRVFDFKTHKWSVLLAMNETFRCPAFSKDGKYLYYLVYLYAARNNGIYRIRVAGGKPERVADLTPWPLSTLWGASMSLDPSDAPLVTRNIGTFDVYALQIDIK